MHRIIFAIFLSIHAFIHLTGNLTVSHLSKMHELRVEKLLRIIDVLPNVSALLWTVTGLLFLITAITLLLKKEWWWMPLVLALIISQLLIVVYWKDAKFGTLVNIIILVVAILSFGTWNFNRMVKNELKSFYLKKKTNQPVVNDEAVAHLPEIVKKWLKHANVMGKTMTETAHLKQIGELKTSPKGKWLPVTAEQFFTVKEPAFIWIADVRLAAFVYLKARDKYQNGKGSMLIKLLSLFTVVEGKGKETDQGTLLRYLSEITLFPSAALSSYIRWENINDTSAKATMHYGDVTAGGFFNFSNQGDFISFQAQRYYNRKGGATLENWLIEAKQYNEFEGVRIPSEITVTWLLAGGDFTWFKLKITEVNYNNLVNNPV